MRCSKCESRNLERMPATAMSRAPGWSCQSCGFSMRNPAVLPLWGILLLGAVVAIGQAAMIIGVLFEGGAIERGQLVVFLSIVALGIGVVIGAISQLKKKAPICDDASSGQLDQSE